MKPQTAAVLKHLQQHGSITNVEANAVHKIRSVSSRITELAKLGYVISKTRKVDATDQPYVRYALATLVAPIRVGDRVIVTRVPDYDAEYYSAGASGIVESLGTKSQGGECARVAFKSGKFSRNYRGDGKWFVPMTCLASV